jgi:dienelactone hydrolase
MGIRGRAAALAAVTLAAGCGGSRNAPLKRPSTPAPPAPAPFAYDASQPVAFQNRARVNGAYPIAVRDVSYAVPGGRVDGYLALPPKAHKLAAVIYLHGTGGGRGELLVPAVWLAGRRAVGLTITAPSSAAGAGPRGLTPAQTLARQKRLTVADVVAVRRAVDLLQSLPQVDPQRIGLVGWSLGARTGAIVAGIEPRIKAVVLMSGGATPVSTYVAQVPAALRPEVRRTLTAIDPLRWIARARPGTILLQDGRKDKVVPRAALLALAHAAPHGTELRWYPAPHELNVAAYRDQLDWLARKLRIRGPAVAGARTGP